MKRRISIIVAVCIIAVTAGAVVAFRQRQDTLAPHTDTTTQVTESVPVKQEVAFNKSEFSTSEPASLWVIVNKNHPLPTTYAPANRVVPNVPLRLEASAEQMYISTVMQPALEALFATASQESVKITLSSGYRSASLQKQLYDNYVAKDGQAAADTYSARPGTSEHQTGLAADIKATNSVCSLETCFATTAEGQWLAKNAGKFGFVLRYPDGKQAITGYQYEPWHIRYVGTDLAKALTDADQTLEEFFDVR